MSAAFNAWAQRARAVRIERETERRGVYLRGKTDRCGPCPRCGGTDRFSINVAKQVFNCRRCGVGGDVIAMVTHLDNVDFITACTTLTGEPPPKSNGKDRTGTESGKVVAAEYRYEDAAGSLAFVVERIEYQNPDGSYVLTKEGKRKKSFWQKRPDPDRPDAWLYNVDGVPVLPYRLPQLTEAIGNGHPILIVEGECKVDWLSSWNVPATCNAGGAGKWSAEHAAHLRGADVVILPDNDAAGRGHVAVVGASLQKIAASARVLHLPGLKPKGDIIDWAVAGGTVEQLHDLIRQTAKPWTHEKAEEPEPATTGDGDWGPNLVSRCAADIVPEKIEWVWPGRLARGKHTCIAGEPGTGKSQLALAMIAAVTTGGQWPCGEGKAPVGSAIILSAEDGAADTIVPRLLAAGADLSRVHVVSAVKQAEGHRVINLQDDLELLERKILKIGDIELLVIDPVSSYLGKTDSHKNSEVRAVLEPLSEMAEHTRVAVLSVTHFSKAGANGTTKALHRFIGSIAFTGAPRAAFAVIEDAEHEDRRLFLHAKNNLAPPPQGLAFRLEQCLVGDDDVLASKVVWDAEPVAITASEALAADAAGAESRTAKAEAMEFLQAVLAGDPVPAGEVTRMAREHGLTSKAVRSAREALGVKIERDGFGPGSKSLWSLPKGA